jgi:hypothetical protein
MMASAHKHHIVPRSKGGPDEEWNFVNLDPYTHAYEHALDFVLFEHAPQFHFQQPGWKMLPEDLQEAVRKETSTRKKKLNSGEGNPNYGKPRPLSTRLKISEGVKTNHHDVKGEKNPFFGKSHSEETKEKMRGQVRSEETKEKIRKAKSGLRKYAKWVPLMKEWFSQGVSIREISLRVGCSRPTVKSYLNEN